MRLVPRVGAQVAQIFGQSLVPASASETEAVQQAPVSAAVEQHTTVLL